MGLGRRLSLHLQAFKRHLILLFQLLLKQSLLLLHLDLSLADVVNVILIDPQQRWHFFLHSIEDHAAFIRDETDWHACVTHGLVQLSTLSAYWLPYIITDVVGNPVIRRIRVVRVLVYVLLAKCQFTILRGAVRLIEICISREALSQEWKWIE